MRQRSWLAWASLAVLTALLAADVTAALRPQPAPTWSVALPRPGDKAHYDVVEVQTDRRWGPIPYVVTGIDAEWLPATTGQDAQGRSHVVATLALRADYRFHQPSYSSTTYEEVQVDTTTGETVALTNHEQFPEDQPGGQLRVSPLSYSSAGTTVPGTAWVRVTYLDLWKGPCGLLAPRDPVGTGAVLSGGRCGRPLLNQPGNETFRPAGTETMQGIETYRLQNPSSQLWYNPAVPFPVRIVDPWVDLFDQDKTNGWTFQLTLTGYSPGSGSYPHGTPGPAATPFPTTEASAGIPDESGSSHPFPLSAAVAAARAQSGSATDPSMYVGEAHALQLVDQEGRDSWQWRLVLTDGHAHDDVVATLTPNQQGPTTGLPAAPVPQDHIQVTAWDSGLPPWVDGLYPTSARGTAPLPRIADLQQAYRAQADGKLQAGDAVGWDVLQACWGDCDHPVRTVWVGIRVAPAPDAPLVIPGAVGTSPYRQDALLVRGDGTLLGHAERTGTTDPATLLHTQAPAPEAATIQTVPRGLGGIPLALGAGTVAAGSLLLAALWPTLKGLLGLFSRIEGGAVLDHPVRARLHQLVEAEPGIHLQELGRRAGVRGGALRAHLRRLADAGLLTTRRDGRYLCYFASPSPGHDLPAEASIPVALRSPGAQQVHAALVAGVAGPRAIAARTGLSVGTVAHHLQRLRAAGLVPADVDTAQEA